MSTTTRDVELVSSSLEQPPLHHQLRPPKPPPLPPPPTIRSAPTFIQPPLPLNLPNANLLAKRETYIKTCVPLYNASINGDWGAANLILCQRQELVRFSITENHETALHIAASTQNTEFVIELVNIMNTKDLELQTENGNTALCLAAIAGNKKLAEILVTKNPRLLTIPGSTRMMPLYMAALFGNHETVEYLYAKSEKMTGNHWNSQNRGWVLLKCVEADLYDIALKLLADRPELARTEGVLGVLARKPNAFNDRHQHFFWTTIMSCKYQLYMVLVCFFTYLLFIVFEVHVREKENKAMKLLNKIWEDIMQMSKNDIDKLLRGPIDPVMKDEKGNIIMRDGKRTYSSRVLFVAAEMGNTNFLVELIRQYPDLIWTVNDNNQSIFHIAVSHRHESIYNILHEMGSLKDLIIPLQDPEGNNMLHLVGKNGEKNLRDHVSGDAFQMQWELLWFKEVEAMIPISYRERKNKAGKTPRDLFTENHKGLVSKGEKWMKGTANQSMVVAALIATIVFAVAFSIPGGYDQTSGYPMFIHKDIFTAFVISDAISLIFSSASILIFLSILTSRYDEQDFFKSLPQKLMIGLTTLFLAIMTMMVTFSLSFFVLYHKKLKWVPFFISVAAVVPVFLYAKLQFSLLEAVYHSIYGSKYIFKPKKRMLYNQNPRF
ncbi:hypothetical protein SSX86_006973 [Deinandra increscens subsp. villosa]|uniref:PGG domain-containing protein n=1 Tax=Deinandra increscens subsp. villosa TaxID=3103831 RepID=A0AAP0DJS1_9ASTR